MKKILHMVLLGISISIAQAEIYKWVDSNGQTHYEDKSVENSKEMDVDIKKKGHITTSKERSEKQKKLIDAFDEDRNRKNKAKDKEKKKKDKMAKRCVSSKDRLRHYKTAGSLYNLDKDGNRKVLSNEQRAQATERLKNRIKKYCK